MHIYISAEHRGHALKLQLVTALRNRGYTVTDAWDHPLDPTDDDPDAAQKLVDALRADPSNEKVGVVLCGSGVGVSIAVNRFKDMFCVLGFHIEQVKHARIWDHANVLAIPADFTSLEKGLGMIETLIQHEPGTEERMLRRVGKKRRMGD